MALPINIEDLLRKNKVESNRIEFKKGWNPDEIFRSICAFATDFEDTGGGYILVGVEQDDNGVAKRPVSGLPLETIDAINKKIVNFENKIYPKYMVKTSPEEVDGRHILVIWAPAGINRPYCVNENVTVKKSPQKFYIRSKASTIEARGEILDQVRELATRIPFDERGNEAINLDDISGTLVYEHLKKVGSKLRENFHDRPLIDILEAMDLLTGPTEHRVIKNVAAMMFCEHPEKFFPVTQVDIVHFPEGSIENPDLMIEVPKIVGPVPKMIEDTLSYIHTNVIKQRIVKPEDSEKSVKVFNYPYQAFEESISNCLYHRDYQEREPVEITIEPTHIDILSFAGPDRSISAEAIKAAKKLKARRYKNRRLGDFLKELDLTEGRSTGIPTIQKALQDNGNPPAIIETDDDRTYFLLTIPCHPDMIGISTASTSKNIELDKKFNQVSDQVQEIIYQSFIPRKSEIVHILGQIFDQVLTKSKISDKNIHLISAAIDLLCMLKDGSLSANYLSNTLNISSARRLRRNILSPMIDMGYVEMTNPDKPKSSKQKYRLTEKGRKIFEE